MNNELQLLKKAHDNETIKVEFDITIGSTTVPVVLTAGDRFEIAKIQEDIVQEHYLGYSERGWDNKPVNEADWETDLENMKPETREHFTKQKPKNLAQQMAQKFARVKTIKELIPRFLKTKDGKKLCPTQADLDTMQEMIGESPVLMQLLAEKYTDLLTQEVEIGKAVKNSSKQKS